MNSDPGEIWRAAAARGPKTGQRIEPGHPLTLAMGVDELGRAFLSVQLGARPPEVPSVRGLDIATRLREDGDWLLLFSLLDHDAIDQFATLCSSLADDSASEESEPAALTALLESLTRWRRLFRPGTQGRLTDEQLAGLAGELWYIRASDQTDLPSVIDAWHGPLGSVRDFEFSDGHAVEVKSSHASSRVVRISSSDQLASDSMELVVVALERCNPDEGLPLTTIAEQIEELLKGAPASHERFLDLVDTAGLVPRDSYGDVAFHFLSTRVYTVTPDFPRIVTSALPSGVGGVTYDLSMTAIRPFLDHEAVHGVDSGSDNGA